MVRRTATAGLALVAVLGLSACSEGEVSDEPDVENQLPGESEDGGEGGGEEGGGYG